MMGIFIGVVVLSVMVFSVLALLLLAQQCIEGRINIRRRMKTMLKTTDTNLQTNLVQELEDYFYHYMEGMSKEDIYKFNEDCVGVGTEEQYPSRESFASVLAQEWLDDYEFFFDTRTKAHGYVVDYWQGVVNYTGKPLCLDGVSIQVKCDV